MNQYGTGSRTMARILEVLEVDKALSAKELCQKLNMSDSNLRKALHDMVSLGLVKKDVLPPPMGKGKRPFCKPTSVGWRRYPKQ